MHQIAEWMSVWADKKGCYLHISLYWIISHPCWHFPFICFSLLCAGAFPLSPQGCFLGFVQIWPQFCILFSPRVSQFSILVEIKVDILGLVPMLYISSCRCSRHMATRCIEAAENCPFSKISMCRHIPQESNHLQRKSYSQSASSQTYTSIMS